MNCSNCGVENPDILCATCVMMIKRTMTGFSGMYSLNTMEQMILDENKYKGKGRPRKSDYTPFREYMVQKQKELNELLNDRINKGLFKWRTTSAPAPKD